VRRRLSTLSLAAIVVAQLVSAAGAAADDLSGILTGYNIVSWGAADGLPYGDIRAMAQDHEGYLWLGTLSGLVRFDGVRFTTWAALDPDPGPTHSVNALYVSRDGDLWVGFGQDGGVSRLRPALTRHARTVRHYSKSEGLGRGEITALVEDHRGTLWAGGAAGLFWLADDRWRRWTGRGLPDGPVHAIYVDSRDRLLVSSWTGVFVLSSAREIFDRLEGTEREGRVFRRGDGPPDDWIGAISIDRRDRVWLADRLSGFKVVDGISTTTPHGESGRGRCLLRDRVGNIWVGTAGQGLWRIKQQSAPDRLIVDRATELTGLLGNGVMSLLEDRDGNIWAGTIEGLNRLMPRQATVLDGLGLVSGIETEGGAIYVAASEGAVRVDVASVSATGRLPDAGRAITAMHTDERGRLWLAEGSRLAVVTRGRIQHLSAASSLRPKTFDLAASDRQGGVWLHDQSNGILRWTGKTLQASAVAPQQVPNPLLWMDTQRNGSLWLLGADGRLTVVFSDGNVREYGTRDGLDGNGYRAMFEDRRGIVWLGGARGLTRFANGRFQTLRRINGHPLVSLTAVIEDESGALWLGTSSGVVSFNPDDFERAVDAAGNRIPYRLYTSETLAGNPRWYGHRAAARTTDGRLWFITSRGVTVVDPRVAPVYRDPLPVRIDTIEVDGQVIDSFDGNRLPAGTRKLEVSFSALTLTTPERTHFRYRLDGFDANWVEVGMQRQAAYTNLPAGDYRFHVMASGADGTWPQSDEVWRFSIAPMFYRTGWFVASCASLLGFIVIAAWRLHLRQVRMRFSLLLGERARLSREIHDTLLQGLFGVALRCDAIAGDVEASGPRVREQFTAMRRDVEEYMREARQSIWNLRSPMLNQRGIAVALRETGEHVTTGQPVSFVFAVDGEPKACSRAVEEQLLRIGQEAVANAVRHAHASEIRMVLRYGEADIILRVADNGVGFDVTSTNGNGHYGLINMRERAEAAGGDIRIESRVGGGTRIEARVPYDRALARVH
jgi:signal transduction histidine kinase/streptogramin lyase